MNDRLHFAKEKVFLKQNTSDCVEFNQILRFIDDFDDYDDETGKMVCSIKDNVYRIGHLDNNNISYAKYEVFPKDATHIYYDEFINPNLLSDMDFIAIPIKIMDKLYYYSRESASWIATESPIYDIPSTKFHPIDWCKSDLKKPRLRTTKLIDQIIHCLTSNEFSDLMIDNDDCHSELIFDLFGVFVNNLEKYKNAFVESFVDVKDVDNIINNIISTVSGDHDVMIFISFVRANRISIDYMLKYIKKTNYVFKVKGAK